MSRKTTATIALLSALLLAAAGAYAAGDKIYLCAREGKLKGGLTFAKIARAARPTEVGTDRSGAYRVFLNGRPGKLRCDVEVTGGSTATCRAKAEPIEPKEGPQMHLSFTIEATKGAKLPALDGNEIHFRLPHQ